METRVGKKESEEPCGCTYFESLIHTNLYKHSTPIVEKYPIRYIELFLLNLLNYRKRTILFVEAMLRVPFHLLRTSVDKFRIVDFI